MPDKLDFFTRAKASVFFVRLFFVGTDGPSINAKRIALPEMQGGHEVPISKIISRYALSLANCVAVIRLADRTYLYDNSVENATARLLFRTVDEKLHNRYGAINPWAQQILDMITADSAVSDR